MKNVLRKTWKVLLLVAFLAGAAVPFASGPAEAIPACGECEGGTTGSDYSCEGAHRNCSECSVCIK